MQLRIIEDKGEYLIDINSISDFLAIKNLAQGRLMLDKKVLIEILKALEFQRLQKVLSDYGYKDLGDVQYWHSQDPDDPEPKGLLEWYSAYDDLIWSEIDNLQNKTFEELKDYDPLKVEKQIFEGTKDKLPPMEG
jgi:hypothetical protein